AGHAARGEDAAHAPERVAAVGGGGGDEDDQEIEQVQGCLSGATPNPGGTPGRSGSSSRAAVRNPVWATMRWSGRTDWPSTCHDRWSTSSVWASPKPRPSSSSRRRA